MLTCQYPFPSTFQGGAPIANEANSLWNIQAEALIGYTTDIGTPNQFAGGGRLMTAVVVEDNLNVLAGAATGVLMSNSTAVLRMQPAVEIQAFPFGLNNLGITAGVGINLDLGGPETASELEGAVLGGFHYWF